ncbi:MAG: hypothetical protein ICV77_09710 [Cyanobacteria bacterium Co-bin8]|nr:hypothetical protein [Cyanobacteria bacterium Co-bin8]
MAPIWLLRITLLSGDLILIAIASISAFESWQVGRPQTLDTKLYAVVLLCGLALTGVLWDVAAFK